MLKIGLTGGIGCGKSTVTAILAEKGIPIIDADKISKTLVQPKQLALREIRDCFGHDIVKADGYLNRSLLKQLVFQSKDKLLQLESILHPKIKAEILKQITEIQQRQGNVPYLVIDVPLLLEKGYQDLFDRIVVVDCSTAQQQQRIQQRNNISIATIKKILQIQANRKERLAIASDTLDNTRQIEDLQKQIEILHQHYLLLP